MTIYHFRFPHASMADQKRNWIADSIDCTDDNPFSVEKIELHPFELKKFTSKRNGDSYNKELSKTCGDLCKAVNSANS